MSYCRWSSDNFKSDLYVYESADGWVIHVAASRYAGTMPEVPSLADLCAKRVSTDEYAAGQRRRSAHMEKVGTQPIGLPHDGATFSLQTAEECADRCAELEALGYHVPEGVIQELRGEQEAGQS